MIRRSLMGLGVCALVLVGIVGWGWWKAGQLEVHEVTDNLYMMSGVGGNVGVLVTDERRSSI